MARGRKGKEASSPPSVTSCTCCYECSRLGNINILSGAKTAVFIWLYKLKNSCPPLKCNLYMVAQAQEFTSSIKIEYQSSADKFCSLPSTHTTDKLHLQIFATHDITPLPATEYVFDSRTYGAAFPGSSSDTCFATHSALLASAGY